MVPSHGVCIEDLVAIRATHQCSIGVINVMLGHPMDAHALEQLQVVPMHACMGFTWALGCVE